jgi:hypothetical protein
MTDAERARVEALFERAIERPAAERSSWLAAACDDAAVRSRVEALLAAHERAGILERPLTDVAEDVQVRAEGDEPAPSGRLGRYEIRRELGRGGMGIVVEAHDRETDRIVALKILSRESAETPDRRARFRSEARAASSLDHPLVARVLDTGETDDGRLYLVMEHCEGRTLAALIDEGPLDPERARTIAIGIAEALACAHRAGIVHRDIKPSNVMICTDGTPRILDFGIAKLLDEPALTRTGMRVGTVAYMSPEQTRAERVDGRADIWSLGVVLHEMLTGRRPFLGRTPAAIVQAILNEEPPLPSAYRPDIPPGLDRVVRRALAKDPDARYPGASAVIADLDAAAEPQLDARARCAALDANARAVLRRLAAFEEPFTLAAAETATGIADAYEVDLVDGLEELLDGALVERSESDDGDSRFSLPEPIRIVALEALTDAGECDAVRQRLDEMDVPPGE